MLRDGASRAPKLLYLLGYICDQPFFLIVVWTWRHSPTRLHRPNTMTSETSSLRKPLMNSHHRRYGTMPLTSHLGLNSLAPGCSPCPLQNRRSLTTSSRRTLQMAPSIHLSRTWEPLCSSSRRRMVCFTSYRTIRS